MFSFTNYRIPVSETDLMGIVHHSYYNRYFERGRIEFLRLIGIRYRALVDEGIHFPVLKTECVYRRPLKFDDTIVIETRISFLSKTRLCFSYRIVKVEEVRPDMFSNTPAESIELSTLGASEHCAIAPDGKPQRIPDKLLKTLSKYYMVDGANGDDQIEKRN